MAQEEPANIQATAQKIPDFFSQQTANGYERLQAELAGLALSVVEP